MTRHRVWASQPTGMTALLAASPSTARVATTSGVRNLDCTRRTRDRTLVPGYHVGGKTGTAQIWDPTAKDGQGDWKPDHFTMSFVGFIGREFHRPDLVVAVRIENARPAVVRTGVLEMPIMSFELFRRVATDAITRPTLLAELPNATPRPPDDLGSAGLAPVAGSHDGSGGTQ